MNNDLEQFSEERLKKISSSAFYYAGCEINEIQALARIALAAKQAKPVHQFIMNTPEKDGFVEWADCNLDFFNSVASDQRRTLYTTPQPAHTEQDGWIKCSERMPDRGVDVLACKHSVLHGFIEIETAQWHGGMINETQPNMITSADSIQPTHWMPLPAAPKPESE